MNEGALSCNCTVEFKMRFTDTIKDELARFVCLFDLILYVPSTIFRLNRDRSSWVEPVLS